MKKNNSFNSWETSLIDNISSMQDTIILVSPYMKFKIIKQIISFLPTNKKINFILISHFNKQIFIDKKSDLDMFDYLVNADTKNIIYSCYQLNDMKESINIIDIDYKEIELTQDIFILKNKNIQLSDQKQRITSLDVKNIEDVLNEEAYKSFAQFNDLDTFIQEDLNEIEDTIFDTKEEDILPIDQISYNDTIERINDFKGKKDDIKSFSNKIITFKTINLNITDITSQDIENAKEDLIKLEEHIKQVFSNIMPIKTNPTLYNDLVNCFIHSSWDRRFNIKTIYSKERKIFMVNLGKSAFDFILTQLITKSSISTYGSNEYFNNKLTYIKMYYPYKRALRTIKCNVFLYNGDIKNNFIEEIFYEFLGVIYWHLGYDFFQKVFLNHLNYIDTLITDDHKAFDAKTVLQELTQSHDGKIPEYINGGRSGLEHNPTFDFKVKYNGEIIGTGVGRGKKDAQNNAAKKAINSLLSKHKRLSNLINKKQAHIKVTTYDLPKQRKDQLIILNKLLPKPISKLKLLDITFTHISYAKRHSYTRSYDTLAFLGGTLEDVCRKDNIMQKIKVFDENSIKTLKNIQQKLEINKVLKEYFTQLNLDKYISNYIKPTGIPKSVKSDVIKAYLTIFFLEYGMDKTQELIDTIWSIVDLNPKKANNTTSLQEYLQNTKFGLQGEDIQYVLLSESGPGNKKIFEIGCRIKNKLYGKGKGGSKKEAKKNASITTFSNKEFQKDYPSQ